MRMLVIILKKLTIIFFIVFTVFIISSCGKKAQMNDTNIYAIKSKELINFILSNDVLCDCLIEPSKESYIEIIKSERPEQNINFTRNSLKEKLNIPQDSILDSSVALSTTFNLKNSISDLNIKIISSAEYERILTDNGIEKGRKLLLEKCPKGLCHMSKPIFNMDYTIADVSIKLNEESCLAVLTNSKYLLINGKWINSELK